jgi:O-methyltransferase domain
MPSILKTWFGEDSELPPFMRVYLMCQGAIVTTAISLAAELGIADLLAGGPRGSAELAHATSAHPDSLYRLLRLLSSVGIFTEIQTDRFALTPLGECLRTGAPNSMRSWARMAGIKPRLRTFAEALQSIRTGEPIFQQVNGMEFFDYLAAHPKEGEIFNGAMNDAAQMISAAVVQAYDFSGFNQVMDVGGGHGTLITAILQGHPQLNGILFDLPHVAESARKPLAAAGLADRCQIVGGDFFKSLPAGADAYILRWIVHDWDRPRALAILRSCRQAMKKTSRLLLVETIIPEGNELHLGKFVDFIMLTTHGGRERTEDEYRDLLQEAGFCLNQVVPTTSPFGISIIEGVLDAEKL